MTHIPSLTLNNGTSIPQLGFGTFQIEPQDTGQAVRTALETGYRHIDTAEMYGNEKEVGQAVRDSGLPRGEVFVTSKLNNNHHPYDDALAAFARTLEDLDLEYLDLFLIHWPLPTLGDYVETWKAMEEMYSSGPVRAIGVSNFQPSHLERVLQETGTVPAVNQIEINPYMAQDDVRAFGTDRGIATEAYSPLAQGKVLRDPVITGIAERLERTPAQVTLRWHLQRGDVVFPKSVTPARTEQNLRLFDFELTADDMAAITALDRGERTGYDPDTFDWVPD